jgi:hypothetical protein
VSRCRVLLASRMISLSVVLGGCPMGLSGIIVMFGCFVMCVFRHVLISFSIFEIETAAFSLTGSDPSNSEGIRPCEAYHLLDDWSHQKVGGQAASVRSCRYHLLEVLSRWTEFADYANDDYSTARKSRRYGRIPIIAVTAHTLIGDREMCLRAGMDGYVSKPIRPDDLSFVISEVLA